MTCCRAQAQLCLLAGAAALAWASSSGRAGGGAAPGFRPQRVRSLNHPALRVANRSEAALLLRLRGASQRDIVVPPREVVRTLIASGNYHYRIHQGKRVLRRGRIRLKKGYRYHVEIDP
jgi:hypothetical protein